MTLDRSGPHAHPAFFCERVLQEKDGGIECHPANRPRDLSPAGRRESYTAAVDAVGRPQVWRRTGTYPVAISMERPSGEQIPSPLSVSFLSKAKNAERTVMVPVRFDAELPDLYRYDVIVNGTTTQPARP